MKVDDRWSGRTVVCIASGPSLSEADCEVVRRSGLPTIAVNTSWQRAPFAAVLYAGDAVWWEENAGKVNIPAERWTCSRLAAKQFDARLHQAYGPYNSGMRAIQFAIDCGASRVILLGYDCSVEKGSHWHGDHAGTKNPDGHKVRLWQQQFSMVAMHAKARGIEILNCSADTALKCFPRADLIGSIESSRTAAEQPFVRGMYGLGDSIYQRAFLKRMPGAYVMTTWPELYADLSVRCVRGDTKLRTQSKNAAASKCDWHAAPRLSPPMAINYGARDLAKGPITAAMAARFGIEAGEMDLPDFGPSPVKTDRPVAIIRPVTVRKEWMNEARGPLPEYIGAAAAELQRRGYFVVSVADLAPGQEWLIGAAPPADLVVHGGEWSVTQLLAAVQHAAVVVGGVGWIVPAGIAAKTPLYAVLGGNGGHNAPEKITDGSMDLSRVGWARPARFCMCADSRHKCDKVINEFDANFSAWLDGQGLFGDGGDGAGVAAGDRDGVLPCQAIGHAV